MNSFLDIDIPNLEIVNYGPAVPQPPVASTVSQFDRYQHIFDKTKILITFSDLLNHKFTKKYVLLWHMNYVNYCGDPEPASRQSYNDVIKKISKQNPDKKFFIIDEIAVLNIDQKEFPNVQVWHRKFQFNLQVLFEDEVDISLHRKHWFVSILGRADPFRTDFFNWILENQFQENNLISYGCYDAVNRTGCPVERCRNNYLASGGLEKRKNIIPFNNFGSVPMDLDGRLQIDQKTNHALINIVFETFANKEHVFFTEKTYKCLLQGHYPLIIGGLGSMSKLASLGFEIPDYINWHLWDHLPMDEANYGKMDIIKKQLRDLFGKYKIEDIALNYYEIAVKNKQRLIHFEDLNKQEEKEICRWLLTGCEQLSNPGLQYLYN